MVGTRSHWTLPSLPSVAVQLGEEGPSIRGIDLQCIKDGTQRWIVGGSLRAGEALGSEGGNNPKTESAPRTRLW